ncbi:hypothetical protein F3087_45050 [Nocardia colli]|uniref:Uncharacterized protein n=1 Tax=Nocardia colli TaxID=2545717 RepID=A0A5N0DMS7_9NOCA|nr:hypothetical protein [Nocardia colli]KAA8877344.1 hypothetical protein F3087_45050 [Nocardia colli]
MTDTSSAEADALRHVTLRQRLAVAVEYGWRIEKDTDSNATLTGAGHKPCAQAAVVVVLAVVAIAWRSTGRRRPDLTQADGDASGQMATQP